MSDKFKMPTTKPVDEVTLYPVKKNSKKRSRDEMSAISSAGTDEENSKKRSRDDMSPSPEPEDDENSIEGSADDAIDDAATPRPQDLSNGNFGGSQDGSVVGGRPATLALPRRMSATADAHPRAQRQASTAVPHVAPRTHAPPAGARQQGQGQGFVEPPPVRPVVPQAPAYNLHQQVQQPDDYASIVGLRTQIIDNIHILHPYMVNPIYQRYLFANAQMVGNDVRIHIITLKQRNSWTAAWTFGPNHVILRSAAAASAVGALEDLLEVTSDQLLRHLTMAGTLDFAGP